MQYWDAHACPTMEVGCDLDWLHRYQQMGYRYLSLNIGFDPQPLSAILDLLIYFNHYAGQYPDEFQVVQTASDIELAVQQGKLALAFDLEGLQPFVENREEIVRLKSLGVQQMALVYNQSNDLCGGCQDDDLGLTPLGLQWLHSLNQNGVVVDCSHAGKRSSLDIIANSQAPVVFSHSNPLALSSHPRNIDDEQIKACAVRGGVIGINGISLFLKNESTEAENLASHIDYVCQLVGVEHVGWGSDFVFDHQKTLDLVRQFPQDFPNPEQYLSVKVARPDSVIQVEQELIKRGYKSDDCEKIFWHNFKRVFDAAEQACD